MSRSRTLFCLALLGMATVAEAADSEVAPFFGFMGAACALVFSCMGAAYGTAKSGVGVASMGVMRPELVMKSIVPVVMAGVLGIYGLVIAVIISTGIPDTGCALPPHLLRPRTNPRTTHESSRSPSIGSRRRGRAQSRDLKNPERAEKRGHGEACALSDCTGFVRTFVVCVCQVVCAADAHRRGFWDGVLPEIRPREPEAKGFTQLRPCIRYNEC